MTAFVSGTIAIPAGESLPYRDQDWHDALVLVERGELEIRCRDGRRFRFGRGEFLFLAGLPLVALYGRGSAATVLISVRRRCPDVL